MRRKLVSKAEDPPEWLPEGWTMTVKTRSTGTRDRYYTCPLSRTTFRSKPEVMRYLNSQKVDRHASKAAPNGGNNKQLSKLEDMRDLNKRKVDGHALKAELRDGDNKQLLLARADNPSEWLPAGWILEIRTRRGSASSAQNYKCYFDPFSGSRFYSKGEVLRYLKDHKVTSLTADQRSGIDTKPPGFCSSSRQKKSINTHLIDNVAVRIDYSPSGFPRGWIKETRSRRVNFSKKDSYYIDPVSGHAFRSRKEAFCYMEMGIIPYRLKGKLKGKSSFDADTLNTILPIAAKKMKMKRVAVRRGLFQRKIPMSDVKMVAENGNQPQSSPSPLLGNALEHPDKNDSCLTPANIEKVDQGREKSQSGNQPNAAFRAEETSCQPAARTPPKSGGDKPPEPSKPLEGEKLLIMDAYPLKVKQTKKKTWHKKRKRGRLAGSSNTKPMKSVGNQPGPRKSKAKAITAPTRTSKRLAGIKVDVDLGIVDHSRRVKAKRSNEPQATLVGESDPSRGFHEKVDAKLDNKLGSNESLAEQADKEQPVDPLSTIPFGDSWPDPCIEFAFKTLTGEIPVLDDTAAIQDYFDKQFISTSSSSLTGGLSSAALSGPSPSFNDRPCSLENGKMNQQCHQKTGLNH